MKLVRMIAAILIIAAIILYFTAKEYALYVAAVGFAMIALINLPINIWLAFQNEKIKKAEMKQYESENKDKN